VAESKSTPASISPSTSLSGSPSRKLTEKPLAPVSPRALSKSSRKLKVSKPKRNVRTSVTETLLVTPLPLKRRPNCVFSSMTRLKSLELEREKEELALQLLRTRTLM